MYQILKKTQLSDTVFDFTVRAPLIARERKAGQFVIVQADNEFAERIPLTIADADDEAGTIRLIFAAIGASTRALSGMNEGDTIANILGPLGKPTHIENFGHAVCVGGGIGVAPLYPIVKALKAAGNRVTVIIGARTADLIILEPEMRAAADEVLIVTDDGSKGEKGACFGQQTRRAGPKRQQKSPPGRGAKGCFRRGEGAGTQPRAGLSPRLSSLPSSRPCSGPSRR